MSEITSLFSIKTRDCSFVYTNLLLYDSDPKCRYTKKWYKGSIGSEDEIFFLGYSSFALDFEPEKLRSKRFLKTANFYILQFMVLLSLMLHGHFRFINVASFFKNRCSRWEVIVSVAPTTCLQSIKTSIWVRLMIVIGCDRAQLKFMHFWRSRRLTPLAHPKKF